MLTLFGSQRELAKYSKRNLTIWGNLEKGWMLNDTKKLLFSWLGVITVCGFVGWCPSFTEIPAEVYRSEMAMSGVSLKKEKYGRVEQRRGKARKEKS